MSTRLTIPERHQLKIAKASLFMSPAILGIISGPDHTEARATIYRLTGKIAPILPEHGDFEAIDTNTTHPTLAEGIAFAKDALPDEAP